MKLYYSIILLGFQLAFCSTKQDKSNIDVVELIKKHQRINNIEYNNLDSLYINAEIRQIEGDTIISVEGGPIEHYSYIGPILPPPPLPVFEGDETLDIDSTYSYENKELEYLGTYRYDKVVVSFFYEKDFKRSWLTRLFEGVSLENRRNHILNYFPDTSVTFDYITSYYKL